jgi:surface polysaccharide O-acyltransferase-like enzyme
MKKVAIDRRNYGIDLLRIVAMFFVLILHSLGHGAVLKTAIIDSSSYKVAWALEIIAYCAVDIFAIISGYVAYSDTEKSFKWSKYFNLYFLVIFYGILINIVFNIINPSWVNYKSYITVLLPLSKDLYWYFTAYTGLFLLMPIINNGIRLCDKKTLNKIFAFIFILFSLISIFTKNFSLNNGYSVIWIILLYILGQILKKCEIGKNTKIYKLLIGIFILYFITWFYKLYGFDYKIFGFEITKGMLVSYISPTMVGVSILYVLLFSKIKCNDIFKKIIKFGSVSAFSIYIINEHKLVIKYVMNDLFKNIANDSVLKIIMYVLGFSLLFVVISILIDKIRIFLFKVLKIDELSNKVSNAINKIFEKISN